MTLTISLDKEDHCFSPGDRVTGAVVFHAKQGSNEIREITITLSGSITTSISSTVFPDPLTTSDGVCLTENLSLFKLEHVLMKGPWSVRPQRLALKFDLRLPYEYLHKKPDARATSFLPAEQMHGLPPTLHSSTASFTGATIAYRLDASVDAGQRFQKSRAELPIRVGLFSPNPFGVPIVYQFKFPRETWTSVRATERNLKWTRRLSHAGSVTIDARLHIPEELSLTQRINVRLSASNIRTKEYDPERPDMRLKTVVVTLYRFLDAVCWHPDDPKGARSMSHTYRQELSTKTYSQVNNEVQGTLPALPLDNTPVTIMHNWSVGDLGTSSQAVPDSVSALTKHRHSIKVRVELVHEGSGHTMRLHLEMPLKILPSYVPGRGRRVEETAEAGPSEAVRPVSAQPPPYSSARNHARVVPGEDELLEEDLPPYPGVGPSDNIASSPDAS